MSEQAEVTVRDNREESRFEAVEKSGTVAGFSTYERTGGLIVFTHTEVDDAYEGRGVGSALVSGALDQVRDTGLQVRSTCPFVSAYLERHPEYSDLLSGE